jgi:renierapurpurin 18,18'-hydroxylase
VEQEKLSWYEAGHDRNNEVFPALLDLRDLLRRNGVPS